MFAPYARRMRSTRECFDQIERQGIGARRLYAQRLLARFGGEP